eukprot:COSAG05_NODE_120_length_17734_cov_79.637823_16_plen_139_part_00
MVFADVAQEFVSTLAVANKTLTDTYAKSILQAKAQVAKGEKCDTATLEKLTAPFNDFDFDDLDMQLEELTKSNDKLIEQNVGDNPHTHYTAREVQIDYSNLRDQCVKYAEEIERILTATADTNLTDEETKELQVRRYL